MTKEEEARSILKEKGYYVGNLWSVDDVKSLFKCDDDEAYGVLDEALQTDGVMIHIWESIEDIGTNHKLNKIED